MPLRPAHRVEKMWEGVGRTKLTALSVKAFKEPGQHDDSDGLYLHIAPSATKFWVQRIVINDKRRESA